VRAMTPRRLLAAAVSVAIVTATGTATGASAAGSTGEPTGRPGIDVLTLDDLGGEPSQSSLDWASLEHGGVGFDQKLDHTISSVQVVETEGEDVLVTLASDLLFDVDSADLGEVARQRVTELAASVPQGATLAVDGHTDSVASTEHNQGLSERRAQAVADVVAAARPDLVLEVRGHGETDLKEAETGDEAASARAQNRRVELRYRDAGAVVTDTETTRPTPQPAPYVPGELRVEVVDPDAVVAEHEVVVPSGVGEGARVRVGVEEVLVRGSVARLRFQLTPLDEFDEDGWHHVYDLTGEGELYATMVDPVNLTTYRPANFAWIEWETYMFRAQARVNQTTRFETYVARPLHDVETVDVSLVPQWPTFTGVPVVWDR
jgi:outer membrane protein OmpA-like peptidoglycan-associated protein